MEHLKRAFSDNIRQYSMLIAMIVITIFFQVMTDGALLKPLNLTNLVLQNSYVVIMALGMLLVIVAGNIDFINMGVLAALAGLIITARLNSATAKAGTGFELDAIAATFIGGASATGGIGTVFGVVIGAFIMGVLNNGMSILGVGIDWQQAIKGTVLLIAVFFDVYNKNKG